MHNVPPRFRILSVLVLAGLATAGCVQAPVKPQALQIRPAYQVGHGGPVDLSHGHIARAREMEADQRLEEAAIWWARAVGAAPTRADAHHGLGLCLTRLGRTQEGLTALREAVALAPGNARFLNNLGHALKLAGAKDEAAALFRAALQADPEHAQARINLALLAQPGLSMTLPTRTATPPTPAMVRPVNLAVQHSPNVMALPQIESRTGGTPVVASTPAVVHLAGTPVTPDQAGVANTLSVTLSGVTVEVFNGNGVAGAARGMRQALLKQGVQAHRVANMGRYTTHTTRIVYQPGQAQVARALARLLPTSSELVEADVRVQPTMRAALRIVMGRDMALRTS